MVHKSFGRSIVKRIFLGLSAFLFLCILAGSIAVMVMLTPARLTPVVERIVAGYLDADVEFGRMELTFFSTFPDIGLRLDDVEVVSGIFREADAAGSRGRDSLLSVRSCIIRMDPLDLLIHRKVAVKDFILDRPDISAYVDTCGKANWNIFRGTGQESVAEDAKDSADVEPFPAGIRLDNIIIREGNLVFDDRSTGIYAGLGNLDLELGGELSERKGRMNLAFSAGDVILWQNGQLLLKHIKFGLRTGMGVDRDSLSCRLARAEFDVNGVRFGAEGGVKADTLHQLLAVDLAYGIRIPSLKTLLDLVPDAILLKTEPVEVKGEVTCRGRLRGSYGKQDFPLLITEFKIKDGAIAYEGMPSRIDTLDTDIVVFVNLQDKPASYLKVKHLHVAGDGIGIDLNGQVDRLLADPELSVRLDSRIDFSSLTRIFPLADGVRCEGRLETALSGNSTLKDVTEGNYGRIYLEGKGDIKGLRLFVPRDSSVVEVRSAGIAFASNQKNRHTYQGKDLLNGIVGYSGMDIHVKHRLHLLMDTTYLTLKTSPLRDTSAIATMSSTLHLGRTAVVVKDTLLLGLKEAHADAVLQPWKQDCRVPVIGGNVRVDSFRCRMLGNRFKMGNARMQFVAVRDKDVPEVWNPYGSVDFTGLKAYSPYFPVRLRMPGTRLHFTSDEVRLDSALIQVGRSDMLLSGSLENLTDAFLHKGELKGELTVNSRCVDCNQLVRALEAGTAYREKINSGYRETVGKDPLADDMDELPVVSDSLADNGKNGLFVVPDGIDFTFQTDIGKVFFGKMQLDSIHGEVVVRNRCIELSDLNMRSSAADMNTSAIYKASDTLRAYSGFDLQMHDIRIDSLVHLMPALDTLFPMLNSFAGTVDFHIAADSWLDSNMMIDLPTLKAAACLDGKDLVLMDGETFAEISKMLMFKNRKRNLIDSISVDLAVRNGEVEIFPFLVEIDRYKAAVGGTHNMDMSFKYHISILKSPLPFRAGVNITGNLDKMKFRIGKAKYKNLFIPSRRAKVDSTQLNLKKRIREMLAT